MSNTNHTVLVGRLTKNAESKQAGSGRVCQFSLANNYKYKEKESTLFIDVAYWNKHDKLLAYLTKGTRVCVQGRLRLEGWEKDGRKQSKISLVATNIELLGNKTGNGEHAAEAGVQGTEDPDDDIPF